MSSSSKSQHELNDNGDVENSQMEDNAFDKTEDNSDKTDTNLRSRIQTEKGLLYQKELKQKNLNSAIKKYRKKATSIEVILPDICDTDGLRHERQILISIMDDIDRYIDELNILATPGELVCDITQLQADNQDLIRRIGQRITELSYDTKSRTSRRSSSKASSKHLSKHSSKHSQASAIKAQVAELEVAKKYLEVERLKETELKLKETELKQVKMEKEIAVAKARLSAITEDKDDLLSSMSQISDIDKVENYLKSIPQSVHNEMEQSTVTGIAPSVITSVSTSLVYTSSLKPTNVLSGMNPGPIMSTFVASRTRSYQPTTEVYIPPVRPVMSPLATPRSFFTPRVPVMPQLDTPRPPIMSHSQLNPYASVYTPSYDQGQYQEQFQANAQDYDQTRLVLDIAERMMTSHIKAPEPTVFSGDPLQYPGWKSSFTALVENKNIPAADKIHYLKRYVGGEARECIDGNFLFSTEESFMEAKKILDKRYGDPFILENAFRTKLEAWPKIANRDGKGMRRFADFLQQCLTASRVIPNLTVLNDVRENQKMQLKLPDWAVTRWARMVTQRQLDHQQFPDFASFVAFVRRESEIACNPVIVKSTKEFQQKRSTVLQSESRQSDKKSDKKIPVQLKESETSKPKRPCKLCSGPHHLNDCIDFLKQSLEDRLAYVRSKYLCYACLGQNHQSKVCKFKRRCKKCSKQHPTSLHREVIVSDEKSQNTSVPRDVKDKVISKSDATPATSHVSYYTGVAETTKSSMIVPVYISHGDDPFKEHLVYALLDNQSDTSFVIDDVCSHLNVTGPEVKLKLSTMSSTDEIITTRKIAGLYVRAYDSDIKTQIKPVYTREEVPINRSHIPTPELARRWPHLEHIADKIVPLQDVKVGLLLGYDCSNTLLVPREVIPPVDDGPFAERTDLGWGIIGISTNIDEDDHNTQMSRTCHKITHMMTQEKYSHNDVLFMRKLSNEIHQEKDGHYTMPLPLIEPLPKLPDNRCQSLSRLNHLKRRMLKDGKYRQDYSDFMREIIEKGYAEEVTDESNSNVWYIPHHGVYNPNKPKIRVVFDCSAKFDSISLNDLLLSGPDLTNTLIGVLCRFRKEPVALTCDIEKMFYQFRVVESHRDLLRFLWWKDGDLTREPSTYRMTVHLFGATSSPGCSNFGLKQAAIDGKHEYGDNAAKFVSSNFYVDDGLTSVMSVQEAINLASNTRDLCAKGGLRLHKFASNVREVIESIPKEDRATGLQNIELLPEVNTIERTLGLQWNIESDSFQFKIVLKERPPTRRGILSAVSQVYDPLGFIAPVVLVGKQILQEVCQMNIDWDSTLPDNIIQRWQSWKTDLIKLHDLKIARCVKPSDFGTVKSVQLHHFSDASNNGYGQCSYLRLTNVNDEVCCCLLFAKSRVAPLKMTTIPRLELTAALLSVNVSKFLRSQLEYDNVEEFYYTDSRVVLGYISNDAKRFHVFVANRVQQIRDHTEPKQWHYIDTKENPADVASRGLSADQLVKKCCWFQGPSFLWKKEQSDCEHSKDATIVDSDPEVKQTFNTTSVVKFDLLNCVNRFSSWQKAKRVVGYCLRFVNNLRCRVQRKACIYDKTLTIEELQQAEVEIFKAVQLASFSVELDIIKHSKDNDQVSLPKKSVLYRLNPYLDECGLLRIGGRLRQSALSNEEKHPIILPKRSHVSHLIVVHCHESVMHQGRGMTINRVRESGYCIIGINSIARSHIFKCVNCRKLRGNTQTQKMADLPVDRMECVAPFTYTAVDYFGPFVIRQRRSDVPRYGVLFTCMSSRAIHLETSPSLDTDSFINALRRFIAIRGPIRTLRSDRGTNFVGARNEIAQNLQLMNNEKVRDFLLQNGADFEFRMNFPSSSHMGGVWERQIRTVRNVLAPMLDNCGSHLDDDTLRTLFYEVMSIVNSRPLTIDSLNDETSVNPLTPNHLLTMKSKVVLPPPGEYQEADLYSRKRWRRVQYLLNVFWSRWKSEYLQSLQSRSKWNKAVRNIKVGDVVIIKDSDLVRNHWQLAIVEETFPSRDGHVRKVKLRLPDKGLDKQGRRIKATTHLERPVHKLVVLVETDE